WMKIRVFGSACIQTSHLLSCPIYFSNFGLPIMLDTPTKTTLPISDFAIVVNSVDNVAVVKNETFEGLSMTLPGGGSVMLERAVPPGHRFAICDVPAGEFVLQYGQPIGTSLGIAKGEWITHDNMSDDVPVVRDLPE